MTKIKRNQSYLKQCKEDLEIAHKSNSPREESVALANYGYALCLNEQHEEGIKLFDQAEIIAGSQIDDIGVLAHGLGLRSLVYQESKRLPDAFITSAKILRVAKEEENLPIECDALANQAQILLDSADIIEAFRIFQQSEAIAQAINDDQRLMRISGALGNLCLSVPSLQEAESYYRKALQLAENLSDQESVNGFMVNLGSVLDWQGKSAEALKLFEQVLPSYKKQKMTDSLIQLLTKMVRACRTINNDSKVINYACQGIEFLEGQEDERIFEFLESLIITYYRQGKITEANNMLSEAITISRTVGDQEREIDFLLNLGESFISSNLINKALEIYKTALDKSSALNQAGNMAHIIGRIAFILGETGQLEQAIEHHLKAIELANSQNLSELEGDQRCMLAVAYLERSEVDTALIQAEKALQIYQDADLTPEFQNAQNLLSEIKQL